jgi:hypothetical protein
MSIKLIIYVFVNVFEILKEIKIIYYIYLMNKDKIYYYFESV